MRILAKRCTPVAIFGAFLFTIFGAYSVTDYMRMMKEHIATSFHIEKDDLDYSPFDGKGGIMTMWKLFGDGMDKMIDELNKELVA